MKKVKKIENLDKERWAKVIPNAPTNRVDYFVSDHGRMKGVGKKSGKENLIKGSYSTKGNTLVMIIRLEGGKRQAITVHKFVADNFIEKTNEDHAFVIHIDKDKTNNHYQNLKWITQKELTKSQRERGMFSDRKPRSPNKRKRKAAPPKKKKIITEVKSHWNERWAKVVPKTSTKRCNYFISDYGRIKSVEKLTGSETLLKGTILKPSNFKTLNIHLSNGKSQTTYIHRFIADNFIENLDNKTFVIHKDQVKKNNHYKNLQWVSLKELKALQVKNGVYKTENKKRGKHMKMTESKVILLKKRLKAGKTKNKILAKNFGITETQLRRIASGENWGHVKI